MSLVVPVLVGDDLGPSSPNRQHIVDVHTLAAQCSDDVPFLLVPVRLQTRFVQAEVASGTPVAVTSQLTTHLTSAVNAASRLAGRTYATVLPRAGATAKVRRNFKATKEQPLVEAASADIAAISSAVAAAQLLVRDIGEAPASDAAAADEAAANLDSLLASSSAALDTLRSPYQRAVLQAELAPVAAAAHTLTSAVQSTVGPAAALFSALGIATEGVDAVGGADAADDIHATAEQVPGPAMPRSRITESGRAYAQLNATLGTLEKQATDPASIQATLTEAATQAATIAILPDTWLQQLVSRISHVSGALETALTPEDARTVAADLATVGRTVAAIATTGKTATGPAVTVSRTPTQIVDQLRVRIFPDDFSVVTHEPDLTAAERAAGTAFWDQTADGGADQAAKLAAWRVLAAAHGPNRAAWVARSTRPLGAPVMSSGVAAALAGVSTVRKRVSDLTAKPGSRLDSLVTVLRSAAEAVTAAGPMVPGTAARVRAQSDGLAHELQAMLAASGGMRADDITSAYADLTTALDAIATEQRIATPVHQVIPDDDLKAAAWTMPPHAGLLPNRFVAVLVAGGQVVHVVAGGDVRPDLALGLDPRPEMAATETAYVGPDGSLVMGASVAWLTDYDEAVAAGMAITVPITPQEASSGFDRVYVIGLAPGTDPGMAAGQLAAQLDNHHYTSRGLGLLPVGTPTNNSDAGSSGYSGAEDVDDSFTIEMGPSLVSGSSATSDGRRLATALGVDPATFAHVAGADGHDIDNALTANAALWPATAGYALEELLGEVIPLAARDKIARFAIGNVIGRGALPTLRIGLQPYGVMPVIAFSRYQPIVDPAFETVLRDVLSLMFADWADAAAGTDHAFSTHPGGQDQVLSVLGLDAVAAGYVQRFALNAGRSGIGFGWQTLEFPPAVETTRVRIGPVAVLQRFRSIFEATGPIVPGPLVTKGVVSPAYTDVYKRITGSRGYEVTYIDETAALTGGVIAPATATALSNQVAVLLSADLGALAIDLGGTGKGRTLAHLLLCQALLVQARDVALRILVDERVITESLRAQVGSADLFTIPQLGGHPINVTRWSFLLGLLSQFDGKFGSKFPAGGLYDYLRLRAAGEQRMDDYLSAGGANSLAQGHPGPLKAEYSTMLNGHRAAVQQFGALAPAVAERVTIEHLDTVSHRLDAWLLGLANARLIQLRSKPSAGIHIGAFGWLESLSPDPSGHAAATEVPPVLNTDPGRPIHQDPTNAGGFIHAPSLNHAATAAILRAGYVAHAGGTQARTQMSVNVSSRRVRAAFALLAGIEAGNELGALLGYQFERDLHDAAGPTGPFLDYLIAPLRQRFPSAAGVGVTLTPAAADARFVVDGLALLTTVQNHLAASGVVQSGTLLSAMVSGTSYPNYPYGVIDANGQPLIPGTAEPAKLDPVLRAIDRLADAIDAVADLVLTEGAHQIVQGNHPRAAAILSALGAGKAPARPEVADTPITGALVSHRVLLHLRPGAPAPAGWTAPSPRADAEPALNAWLGELIGPPKATRIQVVADDGTATDISLTDLAIQPIDLLAILHNGLDAAMSELSVRILDTLRPVDVRDGAPAPVLQVSLERGAGWPADVRSLADTSALLESVVLMMRGARPANSADYVLAETVMSPSSGAVTTELGARVAAATAAMTALGARLVALVSDGTDNDLTAIGTDAAAYVEAQTDRYRAGAAPGEHMPGLDRLWSRRQDFRAALLAAMGFGITGIVLPQRWDNRDQVGAAWLGAAESALVEVARRLAAATAAADAGPGAQAQLAQLTALFTDSLPIVVQFQLSNAADVAAGLAAPPAAEPALAAGRWLAGAATVRENIGAYVTATALATAFGRAVPAAVPVQFPVVAGEAWVAEAAPSAPGSRISLLLLAPERLDTDNGTCAALCLDKWDELIPAASRTTGVAFHYDQPDSEPPQTLLLAVPPAKHGGWVWEDLIQTLHDTFELAKIRTVEPDQVQDDLYGQLLPLILGEQQPWGDSGTQATVSDHRVFLDFGGIVPSGGAS